MPELQPSFWTVRRVGYRSHWQWPHGVHAMRIPLQSYNSYPEGKRAACLNGITRTFFAQALSGSFNRIGRKTRGIFSGNRHKQSPLPFELHFQWSRSNGDSTFFPTNLEQHPRLDAGLTTNVFRNHQPSGMINGGFHGTKCTRTNTVRQGKPQESLRGGCPARGRRVQTVQYYRAQTFTS